ncbi:ribonuclease III [Alteromonas sp. 5E99-2]|uniref:ribonuclease III n=1 Tax=Alteromonas sp. 5E99-2 TaxID=2817683 RepID=UPI001A99BB9E|nr:ribonuclease III [Alteromonas sp. 5E99-2]MBO1255306.1 ribonuclease III [Alteromonas sp. 5E99-2]
MQKRSRYAQIFDKIGYTFTDVNLFEQAITHRSAAKVHNERLEFLGDAVLGLVIAEALFKQFPTVPEGNLTRMRSTLVKGETLAEVAMQLDLGPLIIFGSGEMKSGGYRRASILADAVEALLGAVYCESGFDTTKKVILDLFQARIDVLDPNAHPKDSKTQLQEWLQGRKKALPLYEVVATEGKDHAQTFTVSCSIINSDITTQGVASSRRKAEQNAAREMLKRLTNDNA